jgi:hypothetical protein
MSPALHNLIKFLARIAVDQYLDELRESEKFQPKDVLEPLCHEHSLFSNSQLKEEQNDQVK